MELRDRTPSNTDKFFDTFKGSVDDDKLIKFHKIQWDQLSIDILSQYRQTTDSLLGDIELPEDIVNCSGVNKFKFLYCLLYNSTSRATTTQ